MLNKPKSDIGTKETVLVRQAVPKYNFSARKLPRQSGDTSSQAAGSATGKSEVQETENKLTAQTFLSGGSNFPEKLDGIKSKPVAVVGASLQSSLTACRGDDKVGLGLPQLTQSSSVQRGHFQICCTQDITSVTRECGTDSGNSRNIITEGMSVNISETSRDSPLSVKPLSGTSSQAHHLSTNVLPKSHVANHTIALPLLYQQRNSLDFIPEECIEQLENERDKLKEDLEIQLQVNAELKRLLVASVGNDLCERVEKLCLDRAQLSLDLGGFSKKISEEYENLDKVSIQADMWRSKYLASRVMIEELANARAYYCLQCHDLQDALQQMLNERHELRENLLDLHRVLQQLKSAFDPLNSQQSSALRSTNVLDLSRSCQQLAEAMRFRLLPANMPFIAEAEVDNSSWVDTVTRAEQFAHEVLSRPSEPAGSLQSGSSRLVPLKAAPESQITRFHPHTRYENLTYNCCGKCQGEINVV